MLSKSCRGFLCLSLTPCLVLLPAALILATAAARAQTAQFSYAVASLGGGFNEPNGVAVDSSGNIYVADSNNETVKEMPAGCTSSACVKKLGGSFAFNFPQGIAVDNGGDVFVADFGDSRVYEIPAGCSSAGCVTRLGGGFATPDSVAVDRGGNLYVAEDFANLVTEIPNGCTAAAYAISPCTIALGGGFGGPAGVAVDSGGDVFVADFDNHAVKEIPVSCIAGVNNAACVRSLGGSFDFPSGIAVDSSGNVYVAENGDNLVKEIPASCIAGSNNSSCVITLGGTFQLPAGLALDSNNNIYVAVSGSDAVDELMLSSVNFASVQVQSTSTIPLTFTFTSSGTIKAPLVLTEGAANLDFTNAGTTSSPCASGTYSSGATCTVNVQFKPQYAGPRNGAVVLENSSGTPIATVPIYGTGVAPQVVFSPSTMATLGGGFVSPSGLAVNASGSIFVADAATNTLNEIPAGCASSSCVTSSSPGFLRPRDVAVDGSGNLYVADGGNTVVKEVSAGCPTCVKTLGGGFTAPIGVAVDGSGDVYVVDFNAVKEIPASCIAGSNDAGCVVTLGGGISEPWAIAVDGKGNVYAAEFNTSAIVEIPAGCTAAAYSSASCAITSLGGGFMNPGGLAVDGSGNIYVADTNNNAVKVMPAGCSSQACVTTLADGFNTPYGVTLDSFGNVYVGDTGDSLVWEIQRATPPSLTFASTAITQTSVDSAQTVTVQNIGNATLDLISQSYAADFPEFPGVNTDCMLYTSVAAGGTCTLSIDFSPSTSLSGTSTQRTESISLTDDNLNGTNATQSVTVTGTETSYVSVSVGTSPAGLAFTVDGTHYSSNQSLQWAPNTSHSLATTSPQTTLGGIYTFAFWSNGSGTDLSTSESVLPTGTAAYTAVFTPSSYELIATPNNASYGAVTAPSDAGYYSPGAVVTLTAVPAAGYYFAGWTGSADVANPISASTTVTMNGPENLTANFAPVASISNFVVNVATDNDGGNASNCTPQSSTTTNSSGLNCELRDALAAAAGAGAGHIYFDTSQFTLPTTIQETYGPGTMAIPPNTSIYGLASPAITVLGNGSASVFSVASGVTASISNLTMSSIAGPGPSNGGGIFDNGASLSLSNSTITGNAASNNGGGIYASGGTLTLSNSTISSNTGSALGGGIYITGGSLTIGSSTIANNNPSFGGSGGGGLYVDGGATVTIAGSALTGNQAASSGGAIQIGSGTVTIANGSTLSNNMTQGNGSAISSDGTLIVSDSTIYANAGPGAGGGIYVHSGSATLTFTTLSGNSASAGGGLYINSGTATLTNVTISGNSQTATGSGNAGGGTYVNSCSSCRMFNTILSGNVDAGPVPYPDDFGPWDPSSANNLIGNDGGSSGLSNGANGNIIDSTAANQPMLSAMANYGGATQTMVPLPGSPAICAGSSSWVPSGTTTDQRGVAIGAGGYCASGSVDIGAVQTDYSISFTAEPPSTGTSAGTAMSPAPQVTVKENGQAGIVPIDPASVNVTDSNSDLTTTPQTAGTTGGVATFGNLIFSNAITGDTLTASLSSPNISAISNSFSVTAATTIIRVSGYSTSYSASSQTLALSATVTSGATGVNGGTVTFAVFNGASQIGSSVTSNTVSGGSASATYILPGGTGIGSYIIEATYNPSSAYAGSSENTASLIVSAGSTTTTFQSVTGTFGSAVTLSATVTSPAGVVNDGTVSFNAGDGSPVIIANVINGTASVSHTYISVGTFTVVASYAGDTNLTSSADFSGTVTIGPATPQVTAWPTASGIYYGQTLASSTLTGGAATVPGTFAWTNPAAVPLAGTSLQSVTFTPTDSIDYAVATTTIPVTVTAPNYVVNDKNDDNGTGTCTPLSSTTSNGTDSACSLRDALAAATNAGGGRIYFDATVFASAVTIGESNGTLVIPANTDIFGLSANTVTVGGDGSDPVFSLANGLTARISHLTITGGGGANGGGIENDGGTLTVSNSIITNNSATVGGGIYSSGGTVTLKTVTLTSNQATGSDGGAIDIAGGSVNITGSTIGAGNLAYGSGGGIATEAGAGPLTITNSTFAGNTAYTSGGAILSSSSLVVNGSTFSGNQASGGDAGAVLVNSGSASFNYSTFNNNTASNNGGGLDLESGVTVTLANNTISGNTAAGAGGGIHVAGTANVTLGNNIVAGDTATTNADFADIDGAITSQGNNLVGDGTGASGFVGSDQVGTTASPIGAGLGSLANNGGPTQTMVPQPGSPAICGGSATLIPSGIITDQRGIGFPNTNTVYPTYPGYAGASNPCVDIGSVQTAYTLSFSIEPPSNVDTDLAMSPAPVVTLNGSPSASSPVTIRDGNTPVDLGGVTTVTMSGGQATFSNLVLTSNVSNDTLTATMALNANVNLVASSTPVTSTQVPASISVYQGSNQSAQIGGAFSLYLQAQVLDGGGVGIPGVMVTFTAPSSGAGGNFPGNNITVIEFTNSSGIAVAPLFTANTTAGYYNVTAAVNSLFVDFNLTNTPGTFTGLSISPAPYFESAPNAFTGWPIYLNVTAVDSYGNTITSDNDTIQVTSTDANAALPSNFQLNQGTSTFQVTPSTVSASTTITATDNTNPATANYAISVAAAPAFVVNTKADSYDGYTNCTTSPEGTCSLRDALFAAYAAGAGNITFDRTAVPSGSTITLDPTQDPLDLPNDTRITGTYTGSGQTLSDGITVSGGGQTNVFTMQDQDAQAIIDGLAISGGTLVDFSDYLVGGAALDNDGTLTIMHSVISNNLAIGVVANGGAIFTDNDLEISDSTIANNTASGQLVEGAAIYNNSYLNLTNVTISGNEADATTENGAAGGGALFTACIDITDSTISENKAFGPVDGSGTAAGGGIFAEACMTMTNSTVSGNNATAGGNATGGGIFDYGGDVHAYRSTISANTSDDGGGLNNFGGGAKLVNTILAGNMAPFGADVDAAVDSTSSFNLIGDGTFLVGISNGSNSNIVGVPGSLAPSNLAPLANYGGPTLTMLPLPGSAAICAGSAALIPAGVTKDQRGFANEDNTYPGFTSGPPCVDMGAVQTHYRLNFTQQPGDVNVSLAMSPAPAVVVQESGNPFNGGTVTMSALVGALIGTTSQVTDGSGDATFIGLAIATPETGDTLIATLPGTPVSVPSDAFDVQTAVNPSLTSPSASSLLAGHTTFTWNPGNVGASKYALWIGTSGVGTYDVYNSGDVGSTVTSEIVNIPVNGATLYVRLWYVVAGVWKYTDYTTFSEAAAPALTSPSTSSPLAGNTSFAWNAGTGAPSMYLLWIGTGGPGTYNLYNSGRVAGTVTSETVNIPLNGATLYVRLWYEVSGVWDYADYTTFSEAVAPALTSPGSSPLAGNTNFAWNAGTGAPTMYALWVGTTGAGSYNVYDSYHVASAVTSETVKIPANGAQLYVRLWYEVSGVWDYADYTTFSEAVAPALTSPSTTSPLAGNTTFTWTPGTGAPSTYALWIGTAGAGSYNLYDSYHVAGTVTSETVNIPLNGAALYVRLWYEVSGVWDYVDYTSFSEAVAPAFTGPSASSPLAGNTTFTWNSGTGAPSIYVLSIGTTGAGSSNVYDSGLLTGTVRSETVNIPANGATLYVRLWYVVSGVFNYIDYNTLSEAQAPALTGPSASSPLAGNTTFTWTPGTAAPSMYMLWIGTGGAGTKDVYNSGHVTSAVTSETAKIPVNGAALYVRLWYEVSGVWDYIDYTTYSEAVAPALTGPSASSALFGNTNFAWNSGTGAPTIYSLWIGTTGPGSYDVYNSGELANTVMSRSVNIKANGAQLYVRLWYVVGGAWNYVDYTTYIEQTP